MFYVLLFQTKLITKWLSVYWLLDATMALPACLIVMFNIVEVFTLFYIALNLPLALQKLML